MMTAGPERQSGHVDSVSEEAPMLTVSRDKHGDYSDATGRVIIFRIHGHPPWMLMVDGRCHTRTETFNAARRTAWDALNPSRSRNLLLAKEGKVYALGEGHPFGASRNS